MRNRELHEALRNLALDAAALLSTELQGEGELAFDVLEEPGSGSVLYNYRPLTAEFIAARWDALRALPTCTTAAETLGTGAAAYLRVRGISGEEAAPALRAMIERLYEDATDFGFPEERFERVYAEVERTLYEHTMVATIVAPVEGLWLEGACIDLGDGLSLMPGRAADAPPEAIWPGGRDEGESPQEPSVVCRLQRDIHSDAPFPVSEARVRFRRVLTALRVFRPGGVAFGPLAWRRPDEGAWQSFPLGFTGRARGEPLELAEEDAAALRQLVEAIEGWRHTGTVAWALARFEMGCERGLDVEGLSDYLLALRGLLDRPDEPLAASLPLRLAALCAEPGGQRTVQRQTELAFALERFVIGGGSGESYVEKVGSEPPQVLVGEIERHLRSLLRDLVCGYLDGDLKATADEILLAGGQPLEIEAHDTRGEQPPEPEAEPGDTDEIEEVEPEPEPAEEPAPVAEGLDDGVTPSADWAFDEDPANYSAPV